MRRSLLLAALLMTATLAGCLGTQDEALDDTEAGPEQPTAGPAGSIEGVVTDSAVQPIAGATVTVVEAATNATSRPDGSFRIAGVAPGTYTLSARAPGFVPAQLEVSVHQDQAAVADFLLTPLTSDAPYRQTLELAGFMACGVGAGWNLSALPAPPSPAPDLRSAGVSWTMCEDVDHASGNQTQDETFWTWEMDPPMHTLLYEIGWDPQGNALGTHLWSRVNVAAWAREVSAGPYTLLDVSGEPPLHARVDRAELVALQQNFTQRCEGGEDAYCGHAFFDQGWKLSSSVLPSWPCASDRAGACAMAQQEFTLYITGFYNAPAPAGWGITQND